MHMFKLIYFDYIGNLLSYKQKSIIATKKKNVRPVSFFQF